MAMKHNRGLHAIAGGAAAPGHDDLPLRVRALARERFAPRARGYDERIEFPAEDFADLFHAGLHRRRPCRARTGASGSARSAAIHTRSG